MRRMRSMPALALAVTLAAATTVGLAIYLVGTSLPYLVASPANDPRFGELNQCLISTLAESRAGFAVAPGGTQVAAYGGSGVAICGESERAPDGGRPAIHGRALAFSGVTALSFDVAGTLWMASLNGPHPTLWRFSRADPRPQRADPRPQRAGDFEPIALVGHAHGVAAVDGAGSLISLGPEPGRSAKVHLPPSAGSGAQLASNSTGEMMLVVAGGGLFVYRTRDLAQVRAEAPCEVEFAWWLPEATRVLLSCGPGSSWAIELDVSTGERETAPKKERARTVLVPLLKTYVQGCEQLPCTLGSPR